MSWGFDNCKNNKSYQIQVGLRLNYGFVLNSCFSGNDENEEILVEEELKDKVQTRNSLVKITRPKATENRETRVECGRKDESKRKLNVSKEAQPESHICDGIEIIETEEKGIVIYFLNLDQN